MPRRLLAIGAHPDDVEFGCAAILIQEAAKGHCVKILVTSKGEAGSSGTPEERAGEAAAAAAISGAEIEFLDFGGDCNIRHCPENAVVIARHIRVFQPHIVLAPHFDENQHPDHSAVAKIVRDAARLARYGGLEALRGLPPHRIDHLYYYVITQGYGPAPHIVVDVTAVHPQWEAAMRCHKTQMKTRSYLDLVNARARLLGASIGTEYAVGLWTNDPIRVESLTDLALSARHY